MKMLTYALMIVWTAFYAMADDWTVVGSDRMHAVVLEGKTPLFTVTDTRFGPDWKPPRYTERPGVDSGIRVYEQKPVGYYASPWDKKTKPGQYDFRYTLERKTPSAFVMNYRFTPADVPARFGRPPGGNEADAGIGPTIPQIPYFDGKQCLVELADGATEILPMPPPQWGKDGVKTVTLKTPASCAVKLYVNSLDAKAPITQADRLLITTFGRTMNSGAVLDEFSERPLEKDGEPLLYTWQDMRDDPKWPAIQSDEDLTWNKRRFPFEPSMTYFRDTYWITMWFGGHGWGKDKVWKKHIGALLKSTSGRADGPYELHSVQERGLQGVIETYDGEIYGMSDGYTLWKMKDDLAAVDTKWTEASGMKNRNGKAVLEVSAEGRMVSEDCGYQLLKIDGYYVFLGLSGHCSYDMRAFYSKDIAGPYHYMGTIPRIGNSIITQNVDGKWLTTTTFPRTGWRLLPYRDPGSSEKRSVRSD